MRFHIISKLLFGFLLLLITNSCKYDTDEVYLNNIDRSKVPAPDLRIQLNLDNDTVYVYGHSTVRLTFQLTNKTLYDVQFYENDKQLNTESFKTGNNSYALDLYMYEHEVTKLRVVFYTSTNSGSIADNLNSEAFINTKEWTLINIPRSDIPLAKTEILDGRLRVSWDPAKTNTKVQYSIRKNDVIYNTYNTWFIDSTFIGGLASYTITADLNASNYETFGSAYYEMPALSINNSDLFSISWNKFKFYNAFKAYRITVGNDINATVFEKGINDTSFIFRD